MISENHADDSQKSGEDHLRERKESAENNYFEK